MNNTKLTAIALVASVALAIFYTIFFPYLTHDETVFYVEDKERIVEEASSYYLIYTSTGVYKNVDSWAYFKFDSSDLYGNLRPNLVYQCTHFGWRIAFLSVYPNLLDCDQVKGGEDNS